MKNIFITIAIITLAAIAAPAIAAMNPFMDVPASHWAYDAVAQLASRGVISGYPDGTYKGPQPATRYEIASIIARALAYIDFDKAGKQDAELMRRLVAEFNDELLLLGVTVDDIDARAGRLAADLGGWKISGALEFNAKFGLRNSTADIYGRNDFELDKYEILLTRRINETTSFTASLKKRDVFNSDFGGTEPAGVMDDDAAVAWGNYYIDTKLGYDVGLRVGRMDFDWEGDAGMGGDDGPFMYDFDIKGFRISKDWGMANLKLLAGRRGDMLSDESSEIFEDPITGAISIVPVLPNGYDWESFLIAGNVDFAFNERFRGGLLASYEKADISTPGYSDALLTLGVYAGFKFHPSVELRGIFYHQEESGDDFDEPSAKAWRAVLAIDQDLLKFTSLQFEYARMDSYGEFNFGNYSYLGLDLFPEWADGYLGETLTAYGVWAKQQWGESKWYSWLRYYHGDWDQPVGGGKADSFGVGVGYLLNPAVRLELAYSFINYDFCPNIIQMCEDDRVIRFSTLITF